MSDVHECTDKPSRQIPVGVPEQQEELVHVRHVKSHEVQHLESNSAIHVGVQQMMVER
jgi:hypothetical protein